MRNANLIAALAASTCIFAAASPAYAQQKSFNIPAGSLKSALDAYGRQSGRPIVYKADDIRGVRSSGYQGGGSPDQALEAILANTGFSARAGASGSVAIVRGGNASASTDKVYTSGEGSQPGTANDSEIVVTGTNIRRGDPLSPLIRIRRSAIEESGYPTLGEYLQTIPQNFGGVSPQYTGFTTQSVDANNNSAGASGLDLRGLGPQATLVLLNGQRSASAAAFDVGSIPVSLLDRVEILTDGASSIYGSDAVAGVVNIIARHDFAGFESSARVTTETRGGKTGYELSQLAGLNWNGGNLTLSYDHRKAFSLKASERDFADQADPRSTILPALAVDTFYGSISQHFTSRLSFVSDNIYSRSSASEFSGRFDESRKTVDHKFSNSSQILYDLTPDWRVTLAGGYSQDTSDLTGLITASPFGSRNRTKFLELTPRLDGALFALPGGAARIAFGADYQRQSLDKLDLQSNRQTRQSRTIKALFGEILFPIISENNQVPGIDRLSVSVSDRYDHYSDFGGTNNPKAAIKWSPVREFELHGSYSTSFRAPDFSSTLSGNDVAFLTPVPDPQSSSGSSLALVRFGGNPNLKPETARSWTLGGKFQTAGGNPTYFSVDYFNISYTNRIVYVINEAGLTFLSSNRFNQFVTRNPSAARIADFLSPPGLQFFNFAGVAPSNAQLIADFGYANAGSTKVAGLDLGAGTAFDLGNGRLSLSSTGTYFLEYGQRFVPTDMLNSLLAAKYYPVRLKGYAAADWRSGPWSAHLQGNYTDSYFDKTDAVCTPTKCSVAAWFTVDTAIKFTGRGERGWLNGLTVTLAAQNVLDSNPPFVPETYGTGYDPSHANPLGRVISLSIRKHW